MSNLVSVCAWCNMVKTPIGWMEEASAYEQLGIGQGDMMIDKTHGICPSCASKWTKIGKAQFLRSCEHEVARVGNYYSRSS
ncbi:hypothetical protein WDW89_08695 [Deltaproteobacteria bacterium TL4]